MTKDIEEYVKTYDSCQKKNKSVRKHKLNPIEVKKLFHMIGIDVVEPLSETTKTSI